MKAKSRALVVKRIDAEVAAWRELRAAPIVEARRRLLGLPQ